MMYLPTQYASITIGPLECKGKNKVARELDGGSCHSLKLQGRPTGYYVLDTEDSLEPNHNSGQWGPQTIR